MKFFPAFFTFFANNNSRRNIRLLVRFLLILAALIFVFSVIFHALMESEGQKHSWATSLYWVLTVMSTLGFGDITFQTDAGRIFTVLVLLSGMVFLLILLPFTLIEFFYAPFIQAQRRALAPRQVPEGVTRHVLLTNLNPVNRTLIQRLKDYGVPYFVLVDEVEDAIELRDEGISAVVGEADDPATYGRLNLEDASMVVATDTDTKNTNIAFTVRGLNDRVPIVTSASNADSVDILELAGSTEVLRLDEMMGQALARHVIGCDAEAHLLGSFGEVQIAEATMRGTPLVGKTIAEAGLRKVAAVTIVGVWHRGTFSVARPDTLLRADTILMIAGSAEEIAKYSLNFCIYHVSAAPIVIVGGGRVGRAAARLLAQRGVAYRIIENNPERVREGAAYILGSAADRETLDRAGFAEAPTVMITTHEDDLNIYLTIYCRRLREDIEIIARSVLNRNVTTLHRAGADFVLSYASMGANAIFNVLKRGEVLMVAEGLNVFAVKMPPSLRAYELRQAGITERTGCHVVGIRTAGRVNVGPTAQVSLAEADELILVGTPVEQGRFLEAFG